MNGEMSFESFNDFENLWKELNCLRTDEMLEDNKVVCLNGNCDSTEFIHEANEYTCAKCFTVQSKIFDENAEWRYYGNDDRRTSDPNRCGLPINELMPRSSIGTVIGTENSKQKFFQYSRMRKYHLWNSIPYRERSLFTILSGLNIQAGNHGLSQSIIDDAKVMYKKLSEERISRGENRNGLIASSIYMSCKSNNVPRSAKEVAKIFNLSISTMTKGCKKFNEIMTDMNYESSKPEDFIKRFCCKLNRSDIAGTCLKAAEIIDKYSIVPENAPPSIAAGVIYLVSDELKLGITKKNISKCCEISEVTINKCYKKLQKFRQVIFPRSEET